MKKKIGFHLMNGRSNRNEYINLFIHRSWNVFKPICDEFEKRGIDLLYLTQSDDDPALSQKYNHVKENL